MTQCYIFDIDGTLADASHRIHHIKKCPKDWDSFFEWMINDRPFPHILKLAHTLHDAAELEGDPCLLFVSGRPERYRTMTIDWLLSVGLLTDGRMRLYMRPDGDRRDDDIIKYEILQQLKDKGYEPIMAFDDRDRIVKMWRANGVPCLQVSEGDF